MSHDSGPPSPPVPSAKSSVDGFTRPVDPEKEVALTLAGLVRVCRQLRLGELEERDRAPPLDEPCIVFLTYTDGIRITHMREGGRISPYNVHYALDPSWFTFDPVSSVPVSEGQFGGTIDLGPQSKDKRRPLYLLQGISFDDSGKHPTLWKYSPPRLVTYLVQSFSDGRTDSYRNDGVPLEWYSDVPLCSTEKLEDLVGDKLHTRILLACNDVGFPATLAFVYKPAIKYNVPKELTVQVCTVREQSGEQLRAHIKEQVMEWLGRNSAIPRVVVKPSGASFQQSRGVTFHDTSDAAAIVSAAYELVGQLHEGETVLVEEFLQPMAPRTVVNAREAALVTVLRGKQPARGRELMSVEDRLHLSKIAPPRLGHRLRVVVHRGIGGRCEVATIVCGIGDLSRPIGGHNTIPRTFDQFCDTWGIAKGSPRDDARRAVCIEAERTLQAIIDFENGLSDLEKGSPYGQTDVIGLDMILSTRHGVIVPAVIEVNGFDSTSQSQVLEYCISRLHGNVVRTWLTTAVHRSTLYMLKRNKHVVALCGGSQSAVHALAAAKRMQVRLSIITPCDPTESLREAASESPHSLHVIQSLSCVEVTKSVALILDALRGDDSPPSAVHGVVAFCHTLGAVAHALSVHLKIAPVSSPVVELQEFQQAMLDSYREPMYHSCCPKLLLLKQRALVKSAEEVETSVSALRPPILIRPNVSPTYLGASIAFTAIDAKKQAKALLSQLTCRPENTSYALGEGVLLSEYTDGSLHDVYVLVHNGELVFGFVVDIGPPNLPGNVGPTAFRMPTQLGDDGEETLISMTYFVLNEMKVGNGIYCCQMQMRATLPNMLSLNVCAGGDFISSCCKHVFGVSLTDSAIALACNIRPAVPRPRRVRKHVTAAVLYKTRHVCSRTDEGVAYLRKLAQRDVLATWVLEQVHAPGVTGSEQPDRVVACFGDSLEASQAALRTALDVLAIDDDDHTVWFVNNM